MRKHFVALLLCAAAVPAFAQNTTLTLEEAINLAQRNNPQYQQTLNQRRITALGIRSAYGSLLPSLNTSLGFSWREGLPVIIEGQQFGNAVDVLGSSYGFGVGLSYDMSNILGPKRARAAVDVQDANVTAQAQTLRQQVTTQYIATVQAVKNADLQDTLVKSLELSYQLARAKEQIGSDISLNTKNAQVAMQSQELIALRGHNTAEQELIRLFELIGVPAQPGTRLTTEFTIAEPKFVLGDLIAMAKSSNASLAAARATERSAEITRTQTRGAYYLPRLSIQTGVGGATNMPTDATGDARKWPFAFQRNAISVGGTFGLTLFDGFRREQQIETTAIQINNAQQDIRRVDLQITNSVTSLLSQLQLDWRAYQLQIQIVDAAREALVLAQERYRIGSTAYLDLSAALDRYQREQNNLLNNTFAYHRTYAQLEAAVGRPLR